MAEQLQPGDIFLTRGASLISRLIRFFTRSRGESRTLVNHVGIVVEGGDVSRAVVVEALRVVTRRGLADGYAGTGTSVAVFRPINLTSQETDVIVQAAERYVGRKYGYVKIVAHALDWMLNGVYLFRRLIGSDEYPICSWVVAHAYAKAGKTFGVEPGAASPDDICDFVTENPDKYVQVRALIPIGEDAIS